VVTICTVQWGLYEPYSDHYMYGTVVTISTIQWSLYVPHSGHYMYRQFNIQQFYVLLTQSICVFCVDLRTNSAYLLTCVSSNTPAFVTKTPTIQNLQESFPRATLDPYCNVTGSCNGTKEILDSWRGRYCRYCKYCRYSRQLHSQSLAKHPA
jgi:hypothetical protein